MSALQRLPPEILRLIIDNIDGSLIPISTFSKWALDCLAYARYRHINLRRGTFASYALCVDADKKLQDLEISHLVLWKSSG